MPTTYKINTALVVTTLGVTFACSLLGWQPSTYLTVGFIAGEYAVALVVSPLAP